VPEDLARLVTCNYPHGYCHTMHNNWEILVDLSAQPIDPRKTLTYVHPNHPEIKDILVKTLNNYKVSPALYLVSPFEFLQRFLDRLLNLNVKRIIN
jgi:hypothetical protein